MRSLLVASLLLALACGAARAADPQHPVMPLGKPLPAFSLPGIDGRTYTADDFKDAKVLAIVFTANHCPTAQAYEERIKQLAADYQPRGVAVIAINPNRAEAVRLDEMGHTDLGDTFEEMKVRAAHRQFNFPYLDDGPTEAFASQFGPAATPHVFIFDGARRLRYQGRIDDSERESLVTSRDTRAALDALLAGGEPPVATTRVFGCSTKWADKVENNVQWRARVRQEPVALEAADAAALRELRANKSGKVRMINVWATWCGPCVSEFDELVETNLRFRHRDFELVSLAAQFPDEKDKVLGFLQQRHASMRNLIFGETDKYKLMEALDPEWSGALPHTIVLGPDGEVLYRQTGELDFLELRRAIVPALNKITPWPGLSERR